MSERTFWISDFHARCETVVATEIEREDLIRKGQHGGQQRYRNYAVYKDETFEGLPEVFSGSGGTKISNRMAEIFKKYNLGDTFLNPVDLVRSDRKTVANTDYHVIGDWNKYTALVPEKSTLEAPIVTRWHDPTLPPQCWYVPSSPEDHSITLAPPPEAKNICMWGDDMLRNVVCIRDDLGQDLIDAGYEEYFGFQKSVLIIK